MTDEKKGVGEGPISDEIQERLGEKLREAYSDVMEEPVPDRFVELLNKLALSEPGEGKSNSDG